MAFEPFWDESLVDEIVELTDGCRVAYRGAEFWMHYEVPSPEMLEGMVAEARGTARILIGARSRFPEDVERGELISVNGDDYVIGDYRNSDDGEDIYIALTRTTRTEF